MTRQRRYDAFLIRRWSLDDGVQRVEVTHVQSGARTIVTSLAQATDWIEERTIDTPDDQPADRTGGRGPPRR